MRMLRFLFGPMVGAALMYFLDPRMGSRRRALLSDQIVKLLNTSSEQWDDVSETAADRLRGTAAETRSRFTADDVSDEKLVARVRSEMGRYVSHPGAVDVRANNGRVTLTGNILAEEVQSFVSRLKSIQGVKSVENQLQVHEDAGNIPDLQGGTTRPEMR